jgi:hypothetical protein
MPQRPGSPARRPADLKKRAVRNARFAVWARLGVVAALSAAMLWWPYPRTCGAGLAAYLGATSMILVGGLWVVACTWIVRMPRTHAFAMLVTLYGLGMITAEILPRVGYAKPDAAHPAIWACAEPVSALP